MKVCKSCGQTLDDECFGFEPRVLDKKRANCHTCEAKYCAEKRSRSGEVYREWHRQHARKHRLAHPEEYALTRTAWYAKHREEVLGKNKTIYKQKKRARAAVATALTNGSLTKPSRCSDCGKLASVEAHHSDYSKYLDVSWLCSSCHGVKHRRQASS